MAISFVGSAENSGINGSDVTLTLPGGMQQNDLVIVAYAVGDNDNLDFDMAMSTAGYTEISDLFANDDQDSNLGVFYKFMGVTPDSTAIVVGRGGADASVAAVCMVFRGVNTGTPLDVTPTTATGINTMHPDPPTIDWVTAGTWTVIVGASGHTLGGTGTYSFPSGYGTNSIDRGSDEVSDCTVGMGYNSAPSDPESPAVMTHSGTDSISFAWCATTIALRPKADGRADISWAEFETPDVSNRAEVSWAEFEVPTVDGRADVSWAELEVPSLDARAEVSWAEFEVPFPDGRADISWAEFETPDAPGAGQRFRVKLVWHFILRGGA